MWSSSSGIGFSSQVVSLHIEHLGSSTPSLKSLFLSLKDWMGNSLFKYLLVERLGGSFFFFFHAWPVKCDVSRLKFEIAFLSTS